MMLISGGPWKGILTGRKGNSVAERAVFTVCTVQYIIIGVLLLKLKNVFACEIYVPTIWDE